MEDHARPKSRTVSYHTILHIGANDLPTQKIPDEIKKSTVPLASVLKTKSCDVSISGITSRNDEHRKKAIEVNKELKNLCLENNLSSNKKKTEN